MNTLVREMLPDDLPEFLKEIALGGPLTASGATGISRRQFVKVTGIAGGGLVLACSFGVSRTAHAQSGPSHAGEFVPNAFVQIRADDTIVIFAKNPEAGQGIKTGLPLIIAEELDADWSKVQVVQAPVDAKRFGPQFAGGSFSTPMNWMPSRQAGAVARAMLVAAAAKTWGVPVAGCVTEPSVVVHTPSGRRLSYGALADAAARLPVPDVAAVPLKARENFRLLGTRVTGVDNHLIVQGQPLFGIDQRLPGMSYAVFQKSPAIGAKVVSANLDHIRSLPGVKDAFVLDAVGNGNEFSTNAGAHQSGVAIVGTSTWAALKAKQALDIVWDKTGASTASWSGAVAEAKKAAQQATGPMAVANTGDVDAVFAKAGKTVEAFYQYQFVSHANLEPQNCTAWYKDGGVEIWAPTQMPGGAITIGAAVCGVPEDKVVVHQTRIGGGFGRRLANDYVAEVAAIAKRVEGPVHLQWTREDDMEHDFYRPGGFHAFKAALDESGKLVAWSDHFMPPTADGQKPVNSGDLRGGEFPTNVLADSRITQTLLPAAMPTGPWRAPGSNVHAFVMECFLHECAVAAGRDHAEFLLEVLGEPRMAPDNPRGMNTGRAAAVIKAVAEKAGWGRQMPAGSGLGLAFHYSHGGYFAEVAEVSVDANKKLTVHKVTVVGDIGPVVNMSAAENQVQGSVIDGFSTMMGLQITFEGGAVQQRNFNQYPILRMPKAPVVEAHFIQSEFDPTGCGEPALPPAAPAIVNAIFAATGERVRTLPLSQSGFTV